MTLSIFDGVRAHWFYGLEKNAARALRETSVAQGVHFHSADEECARGAGCYAIRLAS